MVGVSKDTVARAVSNETPDEGDAVANVEAKWKRPARLETLFVRRPMNLPDCKNAGLPVGP
jgi:hypothetical protein